MSRKKICIAITNENDSAVIQTTDRIKDCVDRMGGPFDYSIVMVKDMEKVVNTTPFDMYILKAEAVRPIFERVIEYIPPTKMIVLCADAIFSNTYLAPKRISHTVGPQLSTETINALKPSVLHIINLN